ncbi:ATP-binding protein [Parasporobacterium paucivorans]|uniref:histidine kinase n=1 Tax=Parasporobacterium paucivorans DSM 15970 TaxID=1122934 RepID=A0A1M6IVD5_9FIRM|nr:ATP-binding protein [Parasporobacterium paucivorans]SHJ38368.1 two-component system, OmpR family, sensor histidine kinase KdpD [Parasporobacterium paucivorans DSM 15970]
MDREEEHILVCLSSSPSNEKIIRAAARMAEAYHCRFTALFIETSDFEKMSEEDKSRLQFNTRLAGNLGARIETISGEDVALQISEYARLSFVTKIVVGRSNDRKKIFLQRATLADKVASQSPRLEIFIIPDASEDKYNIKKYRPKGAKFFFVSDVIVSLAIFIAAILISNLFQYLGFSESNIITVFILAVLIIAVITHNIIYCLVCSVLGVLVFNFLYIEPKFTMSAYESGYPVTFLIMFISAFITGTLAGGIRRQEKQFARSGYRTAILLETTRLIQKKENKDDIIDVMINQLMKMLNRPIFFYGIEDIENGLGEPILYKPDSVEINKSEYTDEYEKSVARWVLENKKQAGASTNVHSGAKCLYMSVRSNDRIFCIIGIPMKEDKLTPFEHDLIVSILGECALALAKNLFAGQKEEAAMRAQREELRANLLRSISHDLRTPLTSISGNAGILLNNAGTLSEEKHRKLYMDIYDDSMWLINLVENLLTVTGFEDGSMNIHMEAELIEEVITEALRHVSRRSREHHLEFQQTDGLLLARMNPRLIIQVIINLVDNAIKYTPAGSTISIRAKKENGMVVVEVADNGDGIADAEKEKVFEMFYTSGNSRGDSRRGTGLGLGLCKLIISAHKGTISVYDNQPQGAVFCFTLKAEEVSINE